jgi:DNA-binding CsgD family transcriptional regulator
MRPETKQDAGLDSNPERAGIVLMDPSYHALAVDAGAMSVLSELSRERRPESDPGLPAAEVITVALEELMFSFRSAQTTTSTVYFSVNHSAYTGRLYTLDSQNHCTSSFVVLYLSRDVTAEDSLGLTAYTYRLTARERETLLGMVMGLTNKELAQRMDISPSTAKAFVRMVMAKMGVTKRAAVVAKVFERRLKHAIGAL